MKNTNALLKSLFTLATVLTFAAPTLAQVPATPAPAPSTKVPHAKHDVLKHFESLGLTADQKAKLLPIVKQEHQAVKAIKADTTLTPAQKQEKVKALRKENRTAIMSILTPEQRQKLAAEAKQHKGKVGKGL